MTGSTFVFRRGSSHFCLSRRDAKSTLMCELPARLLLREFDVAHVGSEHFP